MKHIFAIVMLISLILAGCSSKRQGSASEPAPRAYDSSIINFCIAHQQKANEIVSKQCPPGFTCAVQELIDSHDLSMCLLNFSFTNGTGKRGNVIADLTFNRILGSRSCGFVDGQEKCTDIGFVTGAKAPAPNTK